MSASKKPTSKSVKSPAPATKAPAAKTIAKKKTAPATVAATPPVAAAPVAETVIPPAEAPVPPAPAPALAPAPAAVKPVTTKSVTTTINARIDIGFGNSLFLRGEGSGLSWDQGVALENVERDLWRIVLPESARPYTFKFLVNDTTWSAGPDFSAPSGAEVTLTPAF